MAQIVSRLAGMVTYGIRVFEDTVSYCSTYSPCVAVSFLGLRKYDMKFVVALALAIPTYGISLGVLLVYLSVKTGNFKKNFEKAVIFLAEEEVAQSTVFEGVGYAQVLGYASERGEIIEQHGHYVRFFLDLDGGTYVVSLSRELGGSGAILNSRHS